MRNLTISLVVILCTSCVLPTLEIPKAPLKPDQAVVFDIDGTLTPSNFAVDRVRDGAAKAVHLYADNGYKIIYLSARTALYQTPILGWLKENHFPEGSIYVPQNPVDGIHPAAFKKRILNGFKQKGWQFVAAYGDSSTDFEAYNGVGISEEHIFALQRKGKTECQQGKWAQCLSSWSDHLKCIERIITDLDCNKSIVWTPRIST